MLSISVAVLASCGGDGATGAGGLTGGQNPSPGGSIENPSQTTLGFSYKTTPLQVTAADFQSEITQEGFNGFRYRSGQSFGGTIRSIFIKNNDSSASFEHRLLAPSSDIASLLTQANTQGLEGYRFRGNLVFDPGGADETVALYTRNSAVPATYTYQALEPDNTEAGRLAQLNEQGALGFRYLSDFEFGGTTTRSLFARNTAEATIYEYQLLATPTSAPDFVQLLNDQGAIGARYRGSILLAADNVTRSIFVSQPGQDARYAYQLAAPATSAEAFVAAANELGAQGVLYQADLLLDSQIRSLYVDVTLCLCQPLRLADPFTD